MYCSNCGNELNEGVRFCSKCGKSVIETPEVSIDSKQENNLEGTSSEEILAVVHNEVAEEKQRDTLQVPQPESKRKVFSIDTKHKKWIFILAGVVVGITALILILSNTKTYMTIDMKDLAVIEYEGTNGSATAKASLSDDIINKAIDLSYDMNNRSALIGGANVRNLLKSIKIDIDKSANLSNDDMLNISAYFDEDAIKEAGIKLLNTQFTLPVYGLSDAEEIDVFKGVMINFEGISPFLKVSIDTSQCSSFAQDNVTFRVKDGEHFKNGDKVIIFAEYADNLEEENEIKIKSKELIIDVVGEPEYVASLEGYDFSALSAELETFIKAKASAAPGSSRFMGINLDYPSYDSVVSENKISEYLMVAKDVKEAGEQNFNTYELFYDYVVSTNAWGKTETQHIYAVVKANNIYKDEKGQLKWGESIVTDAGTNWEALLNKHAMSLLDRYNIAEKPSDTSGSQKAKESVKAAGAVFDQNGFVIADSNLRYITEEELRSLNTTEDYPLYVVLGFARNEIFARHGEEFTSAHYLDHYSQYNWYAAMPHHSVKDSEMNAYEKANIDTILKVEYSMEVDTRWTNASSSSYYSSYGAAYPARLAVDGQKETAWAEGAMGDGIGEWITVNNGTSKMLRGMTVVNGYAASQDAFETNNRIKKIRVTFSDGTSQDFTLADNMKTQRLLFVPYKVTSSLKIEIMDVYQGTAPAVGFISEIGVIEVRG